MTYTGSPFHLSNNRFVSVEIMLSVLVDQTVLGVHPIAEGEFGGLVLLGIFYEELIMVSYRTAGFLAKTGFSRRVFTRCTFYVWVGVIFMGMAAGAGVSWWGTKKKSVSRGISESVSGDPAMG